MSDLEVKSLKEKITELELIIKIRMKNMNPM